MMRYDEQYFLSAYIDEVKSTCTLSLCHFSLTPSLPLFLIPCFVLFLFSFASPSLSLSLALLFLLRSLPYSVCLLVAFWAFVPFLSLSLSPYLALWQGLFFLGVPSGQIVSARSLSRSFVSVSLALRLVVFRSLDFPLVCLFRWPCARLFFVRSLSRLFMSVSPVLRSLVFRSLAFPFVRSCFARPVFVRSLSRPFVSVSLALRSLVFRSLAFPLVRFCFARSALVRFSFA